MSEVKYVTQTVYANWTRRQVPRKGDIILTREAPLGEVGMVRDDDGIFLGQRLMSYRSETTKLDNRFLLFAFQEKHLLSQIKSLGSGATVEHMRVPDAEKLTVRLPPLETQRKIAAILSNYDDLIENNSRRIQILEKMARGLYREWFVNFRFPGFKDVEMVDSSLGQIPTGWTVLRIKDRIALAYGKALKAEARVAGSSPVYGSSGIVGSHNVSVASGPGIIVGRKGNVGSVFWSDTAFFPIDTVYFVQTKLSLYYTFYNLQNQHFLNNDAAVPGLNRNQAYSLPLLLPDQKYLDLFDEFCAPVFAQLLSIRSRNINLRRTRDILLPKLISGEVDVSQLEVEGVATQ